MKVLERGSYGRLMSEVTIYSIREGVAKKLAGRERNRGLTEDSLRSSEIRFRRLFEAARDGVLIVDVESRRIVEANPFMTELLGYDRRELIGKELWEIGLLKDREASRVAFRELQEKGYIRYQDLPLESKRGEVREVEFVSNVYREDDACVIQCNVRDVTERKRAEVELRSNTDQLALHAAELERLVNERTAALRDSVRELEAFSYSIAHDMRAPLRAMQGFATLLLSDRASGVDAEARGYLERIASSAQRLEALIRDALNYTRVLRAHAPLTHINLDALLRDILHSYPEWSPPEVQIEIEGTLPVVLGNTALLTQCISHLLNNAVKFVAAGVKHHVRLHAELLDGHMRLWIEDNGIGIAPGNHCRVFRMFERIVLATEYEGTGVGLAIVRKAVERMGGQVGFESEPGRGSKFWLQLRRAPD